MKKWLTAISTGLLVFGNLFISPAETVAHAESTENTGTFYSAWYENGDYGSTYVQGTLPLYVEPNLTAATDGFIADQYVTVLQSWFKLTEAGPARWVHYAANELGQYRWEQSTIHLNEDEDFYYSPTNSTPPAPGEGIGDHPATDVWYQISTPTGPKWIYQKLGDQTALATEYVQFIKSEASFVRSLQLSSGAITQGSGNGEFERTIEPVFVNETVTAILDADPSPENMALAKNWIEWYLAHLNPDGTID